VDSIVPISQGGAEDGPSWDQPVLDDAATVALLQMEAEEEASLLKHFCL
jgi:hypothetical protein